MSQVISMEQGCSAPGRSILQNISLIRDVVREANEREDSVAVNSLDQKGAFDRVSHDHLHATLKTMGSGKGFKAMIQTLYAGASGDDVLHFNRDIIGEVIAETTRLANFREPKCKVNIVSIRGRRQCQVMKAIRDAVRLLSFVEHGAQYK
ncbi:hypothetical protein J437_LFUL014357 [Ladona fulva]|uniref:Reverse transcriptase domain-containing protein n=1 Tax=Ladona fulva TaxID=123851 RepID=A0A8K0PBL3_LADFU|nr:hypothetical protein J437_LFUL014357 [Ladona fulva]